MDKLNEKRRDFIIRALGYGIFATGAAGFSLPVSAMSRMIEPLPPGKSIYQFNGEVKIDGHSATLETSISNKSVIETGADSNIIFVVGKDAFILRSHGKLEMQGDKSIVTGLRLVTGKLLSVFGKRLPEERLGITTVVAYIGIRGTGIYLESEPNKTYVCTCYGTTEISSILDKSSKEIVITEHHDSPRYILANAEVGKAIREAPVINHTDIELELIESLVGRSVPFVDDEYSY